MNECDWKSIQTEKLKQAETLRKLSQQQMMLCCQKLEECAHWLGEYAKIMEKMSDRS